MFRRFLSFVLHSRLENVLAVVMSAALLGFFSFSRLYHSFQFGLLDVIFILLPVGILGVKCLFGMLLASESDAGQRFDPIQYLVRFFRPLLKIFRDWFPFLLLSACYYSLYTNLILRVNPHTMDDVLSKIDAAIFGDQPSFLLERWIQPWLTDFLSVIYFSHVLFLPGVALYFYLKGRHREFKRIMMGYLTLMLMGVTSYLIVPAVGPGVHFATHFTHDLRGQMLSKGVDYIISIGRVTHDCFPSLHVAIPLLLTFYIRQYLRRLFIPFAVYVACMCCATLYLRYHYFVDLVGSFIFAPTAYWLNDFLLARWPGEQNLATTTPAPNPVKV